MVSSIGDGTSQSSVGQVLKEQQANIEQQRQQAQQEQLRQQQLREEQAREARRDNDPRRGQNVDVNA